MTTQQLILTIPAIAALIVWVGFVFTYSKVKWEKSPEGRNVMTLALSIILLVGTIALNRFIPWMEFKLWAVAIALTAIAITGVWRTHQLRMAQKARKEKYDIH
jgi:hypothetical protein